MREELRADDGSELVHVLGNIKTNLRVVILQKFGKDGYHCGKAIVFADEDGHFT